MKRTHWLLVAVALALPLPWLLFGQQKPQPAQGETTPVTETVSETPPSSPTPATPPAPAADTPSSEPTSPPAALPPLTPPNPNIAVVRDGADPRVDELVARITTELSPLLGGPTGFQFNNNPSFQGDWSPETCRAALDAALNDPAVTHVLVTGPGTLLAALQTEKLPKPVASSILLRIDVGQDLVADNGFSKRPNFVAPVLPGGLRQDLLSFHELIPFDRVHLAIPRKTLDVLPDPDAVLKKLSNNLPFDVSFLIVGDSADDALESVRASGAKAVVLTNALSWPDSDQQLFITGLTRLGLPSFSVRGSSDVAMGALATTNPDVSDRLARRTAINLYQLAKGTPATEVRALFPINRRLQINAATAVALDFYPPFSVITGAEMINPEALYRGETLDFDSLLRLADRQNINNVISAAETAVAEATKNNSRALLLPFVGANSQYNLLDKNHARFTNAPRNIWTAGATVRQIIFDDKTITDYLAGIDRYHSAKYEEQSIRLDVQAAAGTAYVGLLAAEALVRIERLNLQLTRSNLEVARVRVEAGDASPEEVLRWEAEEAAGLSAIGTRSAEVNSVRAFVNQLLSRPVETLFTVVDIPLGDRDMAFVNNALLDVVKDVRSLRRFHAFTILRALEGSPEVQAIDSLVSATDKTLGQSKRAFYLPTLTGQFDYFRELDDHGPTFDRPAGLEQNNWQAVLRAELPLFTGGGRLSEVERQKALMDSILGQREKATQLVSRRSLTAVYALEGSWPSIRLTRLARDRAERNLQIIQEKYTQGEADITYLIDAQRALFNAEQQAALAVYTYLADLVEYQRSISWFQYNRPPGDIQAWIDDLFSVMKPAASLTSNPNPPSQ